VRGVPQSAVAAAAALFIFALPAVPADAEAGRAKAQVCAACHGADGNSDNPQWPSLAAQPAQFITTSLFMFREGNRKDALMSPMAKGLSNAEMGDLAAYFSAQKAAPPRHKSRPENAAAGPDLAKKFNCSQCHGAAMRGQQHIPRIAGQQYEYLRTQLRGFKAGTRADIDGNMTSAAQALSEKDIEVLVDYLAGLETP
jgi:cytochrome c553